MRKETYRILAKGHIVNNDTWVTGLNNNDVIIGPSGAGKTRGYVKPNILQGNESLIITDTKGSLKNEIAGVLVEKGYRICNIDFTNCLASDGYNPLDYIRFDKNLGCYCEHDILVMAACLVPVLSEKDPFWELSARMYLESMIAYVLECLPKEEHTLNSVAQLFGEMGTRCYEQLFHELKEINPHSFAASRFDMYRNTIQAEKMYESIRGIIAQKISALTFNGPRALFDNPNKIRFERLGKEKTAVFLTISDTDDSMYSLANLFYTQALHVLCESADKDYKNHRLEVPVRFILDDFAANVCIPDFDRIISIIRSREISVSIILQSISQLENLYGHSAAMTILNNCDHCLYLGGQDVETAQYIGIRTNKPTHAVLNMPLENSWLFERGREPRCVQKYDLKEHEEYRKLPEYKHLNTEKETSRAG